MSTENLTGSAGRAALWQILGGGWQTLVRLGASVFLARALKPTDFGLFGMAILVQEFINYLGALGMNAGIIAKKDVTDEDIYTCFWIMAGVRLSLFLAGFLGAPIAARFFADPRLEAVVRVVSLTFAISILDVVSVTLLVKELRFRALNLIRGAAVFIESSLAVILVIATDLEYWALVIAMLMNALFSGLMIWLAAGWLPRLRVSRESFRYLFRFGINGLGFSLVNYLNQNLDYLLVGRLLGAGQLGLYEFSYRIPHLVQVRISQPIGAVVFPVLSKVQEDDARMIAGYVKTVNFVTLVAFPALFGLAAVADVAVPVLWGDQWLSIVKPLQILCVCAALRCISQPVGAIFYCKNRPEIPFQIAAVALAWTALVVGGLGYVYSLVGVAVGMLLSVLPSFYSVHLAFRMTGVPIRRLGIALGPVVFASLACGGAAFAAKSALLWINTPLFGALAGGIVAGGVIYLFMIAVVFPHLLTGCLRLVESVSGRRVPALLSSLVHRRAFRSNDFNKIEGEHAKAVLKF